MQLEAHDIQGTGGPVYVGGLQERRLDVSGQAQKHPERQEESELGKGSYETDFLEAEIAEKDDAQAQDGDQDLFVDDR